jgi:hypothetical protein
MITVMLSSVLRIPIRKEPHHLAGPGSGILNADPDPADRDPEPDPLLRNWHLINLFRVEKYCE